MYLLSFKSFRISGFILTDDESCKSNFRVVLISVSIGSEGFEISIFLFLALNIYN